MPRISVIMPAYNAEKYIAEAIDSILRQTLSDFELIIIDDGSADGTVEIVKSYSDPRIRFYQNEHNLGVAATLNRGLDLANGEYIARMDSDDISLPERFEKQIHFLETHPSVAVVGTGVRLFGAQSAERHFSETHNTLKVDLLFANCLAHPSVMMRSSCFGVGGLQYDGQYSKMEDYDLWIRTSEQYQLACLPDVLLQYRIHPAQVTAKPSKEADRQLRQLKIRQLAALGISAEGEQFERFLSFCSGTFHPVAEEITQLADDFNEIVRKNRTEKLYDPSVLEPYVCSVVSAQLSKLPVKEAMQTAKRCGLSPLTYGLERAVSWIKKTGKKNAEQAPFKKLFHHFQ